MFKDRRSILAAGFCIFSGIALAENLNIKPGLWELTSVGETKGTPPISVAERAEMEKHMAGMPPDMRAKMEAAVKSAQTNLAKPSVKRHCITKEDLSKSLAFGNGRGDGSCKETIVKSSASMQEIRMECSDGTRKSSGTMRIATDGPEAWTMTMAMTVSATGGASAMNYKTSGKWLGAACGNVQPSSRK